MKALLHSLIVGLFLSFNVSGQRIATPYEVSTWQGFKPGAVSYTFDDNSAKQLTVAIPLFDTHGFKVTLFTVTNWSPNWAALKASAVNGHEIGSHTVTHPALDSISDADQIKEYGESKYAIETKITGQKCVTIAYPYCACGNSKLVSEYYIAARSCDGFMESSSPRDFMCIGAVGCGSEGVAKTAAELNAKAEQAVTTKGWCVFMIHSIDNDTTGFSSLRSNELGDHLNYIAAHAEKFWVNTFGNVVRYIKERDAVVLTELSATSNRIALQLTDTLDNSIFNYPISIQRRLPDHWKKANVTQGTTKLRTQIIRKTPIDYIRFDAIPNKGTIIIKKDK